MNLEVVWNDFVIRLNYYDGQRKSFIAGLTIGLRPANERPRYKVTPSLIGWAQT